MPAAEPESPEFRWGNVTTCPCGSTNIERQAAYEGRPFSCDDCGLEFFKGQGFAAGDFPAAGSAFDLLATAALDGGWREDQIAVNLAEDLHAPGVFYWLQLTGDDGASAAVPASPEFLTDAANSDAIGPILLEMVDGALARIRGQARSSLVATDFQQGAASQ